MSRKREREEDQHLTEPRKKAKISKDKKKDKKRSKQKDLNLDAGSHVFDITELVENILKYLILRPETVLSISKVSKRHNAIVHSKSFWTRLGFTEKLSKRDVIEPLTLKKLLIGLRRDYITKKYASQSATLDKNSALTKSIGNTLDLSMDENLVLDDTSLDDFLSQRTYTSEAYIALERLRKNTDAVAFLETKEFFEMVLIPEAEIKSKTQIVEHFDEFRVKKYPEFTEREFQGYYRLLHVIADWSNYFSIWKKFIDEDKSDVFLVDPAYYMQIHFISLEEVDENLATQEFEAMATHLTSKNIQVSRQVPQYYWANIPLYRSL